MKKKIARVTLALLLVFVMVFACACSEKKPDVKTWKVTFYDADGVTALQEVEVEDGKTVAMPELTREGYLVQGYYATPALLVPFDATAPITEDTSVFVAWQSSVEDTRSWMLAGSLAFYPENNWGHAWPQDDFLLEKVDGEFNTYTIEVNLYAGDEFKIAVIDESYNWADTIDASNLADISDTAVMTGGEDAFDSGANIKVSEDGKYRLTLKTDAESLPLCKLSYEKVGEAEEKPEIQYDMKLWASFNNWEGQDMIRNGDDLIWYCEADVPEGGGEFGVKNAATGDWYSSENNKVNITLDEGHYMFFIELEIVGSKPTLKGEIVAETPAYYVVGTCGNGAWATDASAANTDYVMTEQDGKYVLNVEFTDKDTADWTDGQTAFKVVYGCGGRVANEFWYGSETGDNIMVDPLSLIHI